MQTNSYLFYKALLDKSLHEKGGCCIGGKHSKEDLADWLLVMLQEKNCPYLSLENPPNHVASVL